MNLSNNDGNTEEQRSWAGYLTGIPVLVQKLNNKKTYECTLLNISKSGFLVRSEKKKFDIIIGDEIFILIDPHLFMIENKNIIKISSTCTRLEKNEFYLGGKFINLTSDLKKDIEKIVKCFKDLSEYEI
ncbi:PilZ domain-containing protein [Fluviispira multicolorata]|uniref:PilZ domain-containing protein n=1 Tax=Fluviispira multicolorata TaxID=2654512 RepID=A0A833JB94_9BACT|nr:PilZ domain-containing protein [Fluviispira multicolorata]KAB8029082.1 hypothetical protein GCL57_11115 [Fluviispira multicolorata]